MDGPSNRPLVEAMARVDESYGDALQEPMRVLLQEILKSTLITGRDEEGPSLVEDEEGRLMLALFATELDLHFFDAGCPSAEIRGDDAIRQVAAGAYDGLVINPGTGQFELSREDVLDYFEVDE